MVLPVDPMMAMLGQEPVQPIPPTLGVPQDPLLAMGAPPTAAPDLLTMLLPLMLMAQVEEEEEEDEEEERKPRRPKPSKEFILRQAEDVIDFWKPRDDRMDEDEEIYRLKTKANEDEVVIRNLPHVLVEKVANMLGYEDLVIDVVAPTNSAISEAQHIENYCRYEIERWDSQWTLNLHSPLQRSAAHFLALRGWFSGLVSYDPDWDDRDDTVPVRLELHDPRNVYPWLGRRGLRGVFHRYDLTLAEALDEWPEYWDLIQDNPKYRDDDENIDYLRSVSITHYFDDTWHAVYIDDEEVKEPTEHEYGFLPWVIFTAGGTEIRNTSHHDGRDETNEWTADVGPSIFHAIKRPYKSMNRLLSMLMDNVDRATDPPILYYYDPSNPEEPRRVNFSAGSTNFLIYDRERVEPMNLQQNHMDLQPLMQALQSDLQMGGLPDVLFGVAGSGMTGFAISLLQGSARDSLFGIIKALERAYEEVLRMSLVLIRDVHNEEIPFYTREKDVWIGGQVLSPDDIEYVGTRVKVKFREFGPQDEFMMGQLATMLMDKQVISAHTAREKYLRLEDPERENERILMEMIYMDPEAMKTLVGKTLEMTDPELYRIYLESRQREQQQQQQQSIPGAHPQAMPSNMQPGMDQLMHALSSAEGGVGLEAQPGLPGAGAAPLGIPLM